LFLENILDSFHFVFRIKCAIQECARCPALAVDRLADWDPACSADPTMASGSVRSTTVAVLVAHMVAARATGRMVDIVSLLRRNVGFLYPRSGTGALKIAAVRPCRR